MAFVRVKDKDSGHEFDVPENDWRIGEGIFTPVKSDRYPAVDRTRLPKHKIQPIRASKKEES
ncbi:hypothetical protein LJR013_003195 [Pseudarthrobacter oxydans]|uniref:hypothetical protein n=1 Tax=Pseudarthrobacter oxydans TaxID=1671 RepID=UPI003ECC9126